MSLLIPIIAVAGTYYISQLKNENNNDNTAENNNENIDKFGINNEDETFINNPTSITSKNPNFSTTNKLPTMNESASTFLNQNIFNKDAQAGKNVGNQIKNTFDVYNADDKFTHNNMVPFTSGKIDAYVQNFDDGNQRLDYKSGYGSTLTRKEERAPLFKPQSDLGWAHGMPTTGEFMRSRVVPGNNKNNVKPFESELVGPGLNKGYTTDGSGGLNAGMEARDVTLDRNIDQMRVKTNPKIEYTLYGHEGPGQSHVKNTGQLGAVIHKNPTKTFEVSEDQWLKTTGANTKHRVNPEQMMGNIKSNTGDINYVGTAFNGNQSTYTPTNYQEPTKTAQEVTFPEDLNRSANTHLVTYDDELRDTNRTTNNKPLSLGAAFSQTAGAVVAPLVNILRPTKKGTASPFHEYGDPGSSVPRGIAVPTNNTSLPPTIRETTQYSSFGTQNRVQNGQYVNNAMPSDTNNRNISNAEEPKLNPGGGDGAKRGLTSMSAYYNQRNNVNKSSTIQGRTNGGNTNAFNGHVNVTTHKQYNNANSNRQTSIAPVFTTIPEITQVGAFNSRAIENDRQDNRMDPRVLKAMQNNPYTYANRPTSLMQTNI